MQQLLPYLVKSVLVSGVLTAYYLIALRNRRFHAYNRVYLLSVLIVSLLLPLVHIPWQPWASVGTTRLVGLMTHGASVRGVTAAPWYLTVLFAGGATVSLILLVLLGWRVWGTYRLGRRQDLQRIDGYTLVETDDPRAPFSFFSTLFWRRGATLADPVNQKILQHELAHIHGRHGWDSLTAQLAVCLFWINPFFWFIRKELTMVHEFIADTAADVEGDTEGFARMLLQSIYAGRFLEPAHSFFQSPIKRRLMMISQHRSGGLALVRKAFVLPILGAIILVVSCSKGQTSATPDALDQAKLDKQTLDIKVKRLVLSGALKKVAITGAQLDSVRFGAEGKKELELVLSKVEADQNMKNIEIVPDGR
jgi:BlaR1 peptidase M56